MDKIQYMEIEFPKEKALELEDFKAMDYYAVETYKLPIELMMENAGLQLANLIAFSANKEQNILIGIGNGNNGGGGLVAARRLSAWGYKVHLDLISDIDKELPKKQLKRAIAFGSRLEVPNKIDVWVDAYLGFSQRFPLPSPYLERIEKANTSKALLISLDIPTGFDGSLQLPYFQCSRLLTLAAPKRILYNLTNDVELFIADLGIPEKVYQRFDVNQFPFENSNLIKILR